MSEYKWNADAFDAIRIVATNGEFEILAHDSNEILLEGDERGRRRFGSEPSIVGRWLHISPFPGNSEWSLTLPQAKAWVIELSSGNGEVRVENVNGRFNVQLGSGDIEMENCRGVFNLRSGNGDVSLENCTQTDAPPAPERVTASETKSNIPPVPGTPPTAPFPPIPPIPPANVRVRIGKRFQVASDQPWEEYGKQWEEWGEQFGEQVSQWADSFARSFSFDFKMGEDDDKRDGVHVRLGHGDVAFQELDAQLVSVRLGSGDIQMELGRVAELDLETARGDMELESVLPTTAWQLTTRNGDIRLELPGDAYARIDAATRHGEIECDAPLVRVGRPGPGARHGGRMVGTIGEGSGEPVDIHLESQHGDIQIEMERRPSRYAGVPTAAPRAASKQERAMARQEPQVPVPPAPPTPPQSANAVVPVTVTDLAEPEAALNPPNVGNAPRSVQGSVQVYDSQFAILQALQAGEITVAEAEMLLRSLKN